MLIFSSKVTVIVYRVENIDIYFNSMSRTDTTFRRHLQTFMKFRHVCISGFVCPRGFTGFEYQNFRKVILNIFKRRIFSLNKTIIILRKPGIQIPWEVRTLFMWLCVFFESEIMNIYQNVNKFDYLEKCLLVTPL